MRQLFLLLAVLVLLSQPVLAATAAEATTALATAETDISAMAAAGIGTTHANDLLVAAATAFNASDWNSTVEMVNMIAGLKAQAFSAMDGLNSSETRARELASAGIDVVDVNDLLASARSAFAREDFEGAADYIGRAGRRMDELESQQLFSLTLLRGRGLDLARFVREQWAWILLTLAIVVAVAFVSHKRITVRLARSRLAGLRRELTAIDELIRELQAKRYVHGTITARQYATSMEEYRERVADIKKEIAVLEGRLRKEGR